MFMKLYVTPKGALYTCDCGKCGATLHAHEWSSWDPNEERDAMIRGTLRCTYCCGGYADPETFRECGKYYAARYSADGYLDCTDWHYGRNKRSLVHEVRDTYT